MNKQPLKQPTFLQRLGLPENSVDNDVVRKSECRVWSSEKQAFVLYTSSGTAVIESTYTIDELMAALRLGCTYAINPDGVKVGRGAR